MKLRRMSLRWILAVLSASACVLAVAAPGVALAQDAQYEEARQKAKTAFAGGDYEEAALLFREAFDITPRGNLLYNIGLCYERAGNATQAVVFYERFVQALPESPKRPAVQRKIAKMKSELGDKFRMVAVKTTPPGATIFVDEKAKGAMGSAPVEFKLIPGDYTIIAELEGYEPVRKRHSVKSGSGNSNVSIRMLRAGEMAEITLFISERGANVMIDNQRVGRSPLPKSIRLPAGPHEIAVMKPGFAPYKKTVQVKAGANDRIKINLSGEDGSGGLAAGVTQLDDEGGGGGNIWPWVTMGAGVLMVGGGVVTGLSAQGLHDKLDTKSKGNELIAPADIDTGNTSVLLTNVLLGAGTAAIVGGAIWWLLDDSGVDAEGSISGNLGVSPDGEPTVGIWGRF